MIVSAISRSNSIVIFLIYQQPYVSMLVRMVVSVIDPIPAPVQMVGLEILVLSVCLMCLLFIVLYRLKASKYCLLLGNNSKENNIRISC